MIICSGLHVQNNWLYGEISNTDVNESCRFRVSLLTDECYCTNATHSMLKNIASIRGICIKNKGKIPERYEFCYG